MLFKNLVIVSTFLCLTSTSFAQTKTCDQAGAEAAVKASLYGPSALGKTGFFKDPMFIKQTGSKYYGILNVSNGKQHIFVYRYLRSAKDNAGNYAPTNGMYDMFVYFSVSPQNCNLVGIGGDECNYIKDPRSDKSPFGESSDLNRAIKDLCK